MVRLSYSHNVQKRKLGILFLIVFAMSTMMGNILHASVGAEVEVFGGFPRSAFTLKISDHKHDHGHDHSHDTKASDKGQSKTHNHEHNPMDHCHDSPVLSLYLNAAFQKIPSSEIQVSASRVIPNKSYNIERPPRF